MLDDFIVHLLEVILHSRSVDRQVAEWLIRSSRLCDRCIRESFCFCDKVDLPRELLTEKIRYRKTHNVHSESITPSFHPPMHQVPDCLSDFWVLPVEIRLFFEESVQIVLISLRDVCPCRTTASQLHPGEGGGGDVPAEDRVPIVRWDPSTVLVVLCIVPNVPVALVIVL